MSDPKMTRRDFLKCMKKLTIGGAAAAVTAHPILAAAGSLTRGAGIYTSSEGGPNIDFDVSTSGGETFFTFYVGDIVDWPLSLFNNINMMSVAFPDPMRDEGPRNKGMYWYAEDANNPAEHFIAKGMYDPISKEPSEMLEVMKDYGDGRITFFRFEREDNYSYALTGMKSSSKDDLAKYGDVDYIQQEDGTARAIAQPETFGFIYPLDSYTEEEKRIILQNKERATETRKQLLALLKNGKKTTPMRINTLEGLDLPEIPGGRIGRALVEDPENDGVHYVTILIQKDLQTGESIYHMKDTYPDGTPYNFEGTNPKAASTRIQHNGAGVLVNWLAHDNCFLDAASTPGRQSDRPAMQKAFFGRANAQPPADKSYNRQPFFRHEQ